MRIWFTIIVLLALSSPSYGLNLPPSHSDLLRKIDMDFSNLELTGAGISGITFFYKKLPLHFRKNYSSWKYSTSKMDSTLNQFMKNLGTLENPHQIKIGSKKISPGKYNWGVLFRQGKIYKFFIWQKKGKKEKVLFSK